MPAMDPRLPLLAPAKNVVARDQTEEELDLELSLPASTSTSDDSNIRMILQKHCPPHDLSRSAILKSFDELLSRREAEQQSAIQNLAEPYREQLERALASAIKHFDENARKLTDLPEEMRKRALDLWLQYCGIVHEIMLDIKVLIDRSNESVRLWRSTPRLPSSIQLDPAHFTHALTIVSAADADLKELFRAICAHLLPFNEGMKAKLSNVEGEFIVQRVQDQKTAISQQKEETASAVEVAENIKKLEPHREPTSFGFEVSDSGVGVEASRQRPTHIGKAEDKLGKDILTRTRKELFTNRNAPATAITKEDIRNSDFLNLDSSRIAVFSHAHKAIEVYEVRKTKDGISGVAIKVAAASGVDKAPVYLSARRKKFYTSEDVAALKHLPDDEEKWWSRFKPRKTRYSQVEQGDTSVERTVSDLLNNEDCGGGSWNYLLRGQQNVPDPSRRGRKTFTLIAAVAGMSRWSDWRQDVKAASWMTFPNVLLEGESSLTLGTCYMCQDPLPAGVEAGQRLDVFAHKDCEYWDLAMMWG